MDTSVAIGNFAGPTGLGTYATTIGYDAMRYGYGNGTPTRDYQHFAQLGQTYMSLPPKTIHLVAEDIILGKDKVNVLEVILTLQAQVKDLQDRLERVEFAPFTLPYYAAKAHFEEASTAALDPAPGGSLEDDLEK